jgi:AmmeMemoRadiSam system protein A
MSQTQPYPLTDQEKRLSLELARGSITAAANRQPSPTVDLQEMPDHLKIDGACFVTLRKRNTKALRGCTGVLVARAPLAEEIVKTAAQSALFDPRFEPVRPGELDEIEIEISILTPPRKLSFSNPEDLPKLIRPGIDGVTLYRGMYRATFLPQVWERIPDPIMFLEMLSQKMGLDRNAWKKPGIEAEVYQVEEFSEE